MRPVDIHTEAASIRLSPSPTITTASIEVSRRAPSYIWARIGAQPATAFVLLSLTFGSLIIFVLPPLRGPDEISHFLRIYSYARAELLPVVEVDGRKGIYVERELYDQLLFFMSAGEWFATSGEKGVRYGQIMALYRDSTSIIDDERDQAAIFAPFAGTEGYNPIAYFPYIAAAAIGRLLGLDFPNLLLLMRLFGLAAFTAAAAYAIAVSPVLKWGLVLIAMLPVSLYNRSVLSADGAALCSALVITALCLSGTRKVAAGRVWERSLWMTLCALSKQPQIVFVLLELMVSRPKELPRRWSSIAIVVLPCLILSPLWVVAVSADVAVWRLQWKATIRLNISIRCGSSSTCGNIHLISRWRHGRLSPTGGTGCGPSSLASLVGRISCFDLGSMSCSRSFSCSCLCRDCSCTARRGRASR